MAKTKKKNQKQDNRTIIKLKLMRFKIWLFSIALSIYGGIQAGKQ